MEALPLFEKEGRGIFLNNMSCEMKHGKVIITIGLCALIFFLFLKAGGAQAATFYGRIVAIEGTALQVRGRQWWHFTFLGWVSDPIHPKGSFLRG